MFQTRLNMPAVIYFLHPEFLPHPSKEKALIWSNLKVQTFKKSANADFRFDSHLARSMASLKLFMKSE